MARTIHYKIEDNAANLIADAEWEEVLRLQNWYNSEFVWTAGRLALKMFAVFSNWEKVRAGKKEFAERISRRRRVLLKAGYSENRIIQSLVSDGLVIAKKGGYADNCLASGFTKVAANEFNAYLVCEFVLKISTIAKRAEIDLYDEGAFIKTKHVRVCNGAVRALQNGMKQADVERLVRDGRIFSIVNPQKYDEFPKFRNLVSGFNDMDQDERMAILKDWNWLGFGENYDITGDDIQGYDLNKKVTKFELAAA